MLINKGFSKGDIISFKLINGEEIIAEFVEETTDGYKINKPVTLGMGQNGLQFIPSIFSSDSDSFEIKRSHILISGASSSESKSAYIQATTGLVTATKQGIVQ